MIVPCNMYLILMVVESYRKKFGRRITYSQRLRCPKFFSRVQLQKSPKEIMSQLKGGKEFLEPAGIEEKNSKTFQANGALSILPILIYRLRFSFSRSIQKQLGIKCSCFFSMQTLIVFLCCTRQVCVLYKWFYFQIPSSSSSITILLLILERNTYDMYYYYRLLFPFEW